MWTFNATLDHDVPCASVGACYQELPGGIRKPLDSAARSKDCTGIIPAGQAHYHRHAGWEDLKEEAAYRYCRFCVRGMNDRCASEGPILVRVELTYSNGVVRYLEDEAAEDWGHQANGAAVMAWAHGCEGRALPWKENKKPTSCK